MSNPKAAHRQYKQGLQYSPHVDVAKQWLSCVEYGVQTAFSKVIALEAPKICRGVSFHYPHILAVNSLIPLLNQYGMLRAGPKGHVEKVTPKGSYEETWTWDCGNRGFEWPLL
eukprot:TRINITY_DN172_c0_g2_i2.p1 TRINITY_DN172_c0_g2~~TRINITY_DN172_c0_g2_i2.p1  ORF type:complete len:113 (-),score=8.09 TRINITY_DN172_c0_g2_i2:246-584(-)